MCFFMVWAVKRFFFAKVNSCIQLWQPIIVRFSFGKSSFHFWFHTTWTINHHSPLLNSWLAMESALSVCVFMFLLLYWYQCNVLLCTKWENGRKVFDVVKWFCCLFHLICCRRMNSTFGVWLLCCVDLNKLTVIEFNLTSTICCDPTVARNSVPRVCMCVCVCLHIDFFFCSLCICIESTNNASSKHAHNIILHIDRLVGRSVSETVAYWNGNLRTFQSIEADAVRSIEKLCAKCAVFTQKWQSEMREMGNERPLFSRLSQVHSNSADARSAFIHVS